MKTKKIEARLDTLTWYEVYLTAVRYQFSRLPARCPHSSLILLILATAHLGLPCLQPFMLHWCSQHRRNVTSRSTRILRDQNLKGVTFAEGGGHAGGRARPNHFAGNIAASHRCYHVAWHRVILQHHSGGKHCAPKRAAPNVGKNWTIVGTQAG